MTRQRARERKPPWLKLLAPDGNTAQLEAAICGTCSRWMLRCKQGVWESWDPGIIQGDDLAVAIILGVRLTRLKTVYGMRGPTLIDVCGERGIMPDAQYLAEHRCWFTPISLMPYKPAAKVRQPGKPWASGIKLSEDDIREFERIWNMPMKELKCLTQSKGNTSSNGMSAAARPVRSPTC